MASRRYGRLSPDERDGEADDRDEMARSRDRAAQARTQESAARDMAAGVRDEAAVRRDQAMRDRMWAASHPDHAAGEGKPSEIADDAVTSAEGDAGQLAWWRGEAAAARWAAVDQRRILAKEQDDTRILLDQVWRDRRAAAADRAAAARDRDAATGDREAAARDREAASAARQQAAIERAEERYPGAEA